MTCLEKNLNRLFKNHGKLFLIALDHPQYYGSMKGLENTVKTAEKLLNSPADGFIFNPGIFRKLSSAFSTVSLIVRASTGGSKFGNFPQTHPIFLTPKRAFELGADGVIVMMVIGGDDVESVKNVAKMVGDFHSFCLPVIVEILPHDPSKISNPDLTATGARIAAEIGADIVKVFYTDEFHLVVESTNVPVLLAGGPESEDIEHVAERAVEVGVAGFAFGRNIFAHENPLERIRALEEILRG